MSKIFRINQFLEIIKSKRTELSDSENYNSQSKSTSFKQVISAVAILGAITLTFLSTSFNPIYFKSILIGLFIIGMIAFIKVSNHSSIKIKS